MGLEEEWRSRTGKRSFAIELLGLVKTDEKKDAGKLVCEACENRHRAVLLEKPLSPVPDLRLDPQSPEVKTLAEVLDELRSPSRDWYADLHRFLDCRVHRPKPLDTARMMVAFFNEGDPHATDGSAGTLQIDAVSGEGRVYPIYCQSLVPCGEGFAKSPTSAFALVGKSEKLDFVWTLRMPDEPPPPKLVGESLQAAWAILGTNLSARLSRTGVVFADKGVNSFEACEVYTDTIAATGRVRRTCGYLGSVVQVDAKRRAVATRGAKLFITPKKELGKWTSSKTAEATEGRIRIAADPNTAGQGAAPVVLACASVQEALSQIFRLQCECLLPVLASRKTGALFLGLGSFVSLGVAFLLLAIGWITSEGQAYLLAPPLWFAGMLTIWPLLWRPLAPMDKMDIPEEETRTVVVWARMLAQLEGRIVGSRRVARGIYAVFACPQLAICRWLILIFEQPAGALTEGQPWKTLGVRFPRSQFFSKILAILWLAPGKKASRTLRAPVLTLALVVAWLVLCSPLRYAVAEAVPPWDTRVFAKGEVQSGPNTEVLDNSPYTANSERQGILRLWLIPKHRADRKIRVYCAGGCIIDRSNVPSNHRKARPEPVAVESQMEFAYEVVTGKVGDIQVDLVGGDGSIIRSERIRLNILE